MLTLKVWLQNIGSNNKKMEQELKKQKEIRDYIDKTFRIRTDGDLVVVDFVVRDKVDNWVVITRKLSDIENGTISK